MPTVCRKCQTEWTGLAMAHCAGCHQTFTTVSNFDRHHPPAVLGTCVDPASVGLVVGQRGYWAQPGPEKEATWRSATQLARGVEKIPA